MSNNSNQPSQNWVSFTYISFGVSLLMMAAGVVMLGDNWWIRGYFLMAALLLTQSCFSLSKAIRDMHEARQFHNRLEEARTEKLLRETV